MYDMINVFIHIFIVLSLTTEINFANRRSGKKKSGSHVSLRCL